jgi:hypothetical protein
VLYFGSASHSHTKATLGGQQQPPARRRAGPTGVRTAAQPPWHRAAVAERRPPGNRAEIKWLPRMDAQCVVRAWYIITPGDKGYSPVIQDSVSHGRSHDLRTEVGQRKSCVQVSPIATKGGHGEIVGP